MDYESLTLAELATELVANAKALGSLEGRATSQGDIDALEVARSCVDAILAEFHERQREESGDDYDRDIEKWD